MTSAARPLESFRLWLEGDSGGLAAPDDCYRALISDWRPMAKTHGLNSRRHPMARSRTAKNDRFRAATALQNARWPRQLPWPRAILLLTLVCPRGVLDDDNLAGMGKSLRDACAKYFGVEDGPSGPIRWRYRWERGDRDGVRLELWEDRS